MIICEYHTFLLFTSQVACMQFINIVVHSVENMNFRVHLQHEFTHIGLDEYLEVRMCLVLVICSDMVAVNAALLQ